MYPYQWSTTLVPTCGWWSGGCFPPDQPTIDLSSVNPACSTGNCSTACTNITTLFGTASQPSNMYQCMRYRTLASRFPTVLSIHPKSPTTLVLGYMALRRILKCSTPRPNSSQNVSLSIVRCLNGCIRGAYPIDIETFFSNHNSPDAYGTACEMQWLMNRTTGLLVANMATSCFVEICTPATATNPDSKYFPEPFVSDSSQTRDYFK
jgi:hypothetical protein